MKIKRRSIAIDDVLWAKLETLAKREKRSVSSVMRLILERAVVALVCLAIISCGKDDSGSSDTPPAAATGNELDNINTNYMAPADQEETLYEPCAEGKLCPNMTREEVMELLGEPLYIHDPGFAHQHWWKYHNGDQGVDYCESVLSCGLRFNRDGLLKEQDRVAIRYLDILRWNE